LNLTLLDLITGITDLIFEVMQNSPIEKVEIWDILREIWSNIKYRIIFFSLCVVSLAAPLYGILFIMPSFTHIPLSARIVALVDVYDALRSERSYKKPWTHTEAKDEIIDQKGEHFDPVVVDAFLTVSEIFKTMYNS
jgi:hypothetical protein